MSETENQTSSGQTKLMHHGMIACCAVMLLPFAEFFLSGGTIAGLWSNTGVLAPIELCLGAHLLMFKSVGKSRHGSPKGQARACAVDLRETETVVSLDPQRL